MDRVKAAIFSSLGERVMGRACSIFLPAPAPWVSRRSVAARPPLFLSKKNARPLLTIEQNLTQTKLQRTNSRQQEVFAFLEAISSLTRSST